MLLRVDHFCERLQSPRAAEQCDVNLHSLTAKGCDSMASTYSLLVTLICHSKREGVQELFFMNSVASTLNRVTGMEFNNQISVLTPNNWNTWKHDMQVLLMHYGCWQFIIQTKPEQPDEEATYKEKLDLQLREDVGIFISRVKTAATRLQEAGHKLDDLYIGFQLIRWLPQEFQSTVQQIYRWKEEDFRVVKIEAELILEANRLQLMKQDLEKAENAYLSSFTSKKSKTLPGATAAAHGDPNGKNDYQKKSDLKPITNMKMSLATEDKSCPVEGIGTLRFRVKYKGSFHEITLTDVLFNPKLRRNLLSGSRLESKGAHFVGTKDGIKTLLKSSEVPHKFWGEALLCFTYAWNRICHKDSNKTPFEKYSGRKPSVLHLKPFGCLAYAGVPKQIRKKKFDMRAKMGIMMGYAQRTKGYRIWLIDENKLVETINVRFDENKRGINFRQKVNSNLGYNLNLPDYYDDEDDFDRVKDSLTSRLVSKTSTETPSTSEKPDVSSDNHSLIPCTEVKWIRNIGRKVTGSNVYYSIEGEATRLKSFNEIERYCKRHNIEYDPSLFNFRKDNTESQGFSDLSEQQEALMVEVTIPNCYKQAIRSRDASKWHDAMDKEINVMKERKVWDLVDHPDNIKILENRWVYTIKYDENNKIVRYKARLVARGNTQLRGESFDEVFQEYKLELSKVKSLKLRCYSDSDFATNRDDRVSMGGFITFIDETPISWRTFKQKSVSLSTMEAEYVSLTEAAKEFIWLKNVIDNKSLNLELSENVMFCDNQAAISFQSHR
ncbi:retrovirus-related Pol polyprotein from transposon RE1 [Trichonephila clavipes]|nr:retrovirus-related Pol polyprotein from transposon RE1 [Trichonephila clavipes]